MSSYTHQLLPTHLFGAPVSHRWSNMGFVVVYHNLRMSKITLQPIDNLFSSWCTTVFNFMGWKSQLSFKDLKVLLLLPQVFFQDMVLRWWELCVHCILSCQKNTQSLSWCLVLEGRGLWYQLVPASSPLQCGKALLMALTSLATLLKSLWIL